MNTFIITLIIIYLSSAISNYRYVKLAYSKGGRYGNLEPNGVEIVLTILPIANTISAIFGWTIYPPVEKVRSVKKYNIGKFFKIKK